MIRAQQEAIIQQANQNIVAMRQAELNYYVNLFEK
jgi:hypothetical protein